MRGRRRQRKKDLKKVMRYFARLDRVIDDAIAAQARLGQEVCAVAQELELGRQEN